MANCSEMKAGDMYKCEKCGLELQVTKACTCEPGQSGSCEVPLRCCEQDMVKK
jgi:hypothetical protein